MVSIAWRRRSSVYSTAILFFATMVGLTANLRTAGGTTPELEPASPLKAEKATAVLLTQSELESWRPHRIDLAPAKWIWLPAQRTLPNTFVLFRKEFHLSSAPISARGWIAADSRYKLSVNGKRVQWGPAPCDPRHLDADPVDLRPYLKVGKNVIGVEVLFYGHGDGTWPGGQPGLIMNLDVQTVEGKLQILTDKSWQSLLDRAHPPGQYKRWFLRSLQEQFDARLHPDGWHRPGFELDERWVAAREIPCPADKPSACRLDRHWCGDSVQRVAAETASLRMRQIPICREELIAAKRLAHSGRVIWKRDPTDWFDVRMADSFSVSLDPVAVVQGGGAWELPATPQRNEGVEATFEFEEQIVGFPRFTIDAPAGTIVELMIQEGHDPQKTRWLDSHHFSWSRFICRDGINEFEAADFESLRWLQLHVRGATRPVVIRDVGVRRREYAWPNEPVIRTSDPALQRLFDAGINTLRNSAIETIVDGMGRERQQYSGDCGHQLHAIRYAFGDERICCRFLRTFSEGLALDGYFMDCWPANDRLTRIAQKQIESSFWGPLLDHGVQFNFDCWYHYLATGDREAVVEPYPRLCRFADYLWSLRRDDGLLPVENIGIPTVWMDFTAFDFKHPEHKRGAFNLYVAAMYRHAYAPLARLMGEVDRAAEACHRSDQLLEAARKQYWSPQHGMYADNLPWLVADTGIRLSDRTLANSLLFDQCPGASTAAAVRALVECPPHLRRSYPCNAGWRYWALGKAGRGDVIVAEFREKWAAMPSVALNNTIQENWRCSPDSTAQWSHCALSPIYALFQEVVGLKPLSAGFAEAQLRPQLGDLPDLEVIAHTPLGPVTFRSELREGRHYVEVKVPEAIEVELLLPSDGEANFLSRSPDHPSGLKRYRLPPGGGEFTVPSARRLAR